jgi:DNA processing protein
MGRNKLIYAMSHYAVVISAVEGKGGTWSGAIENLKNGWVPMYVREAEAIPDGNRALIRRGIPGLILDSFNGEQRLMSVFNAKKDERGFSSSKSETNELPYETKTLETGRGSSIESEVHETEIIDDLFEVVWPYIQNALMLAQESSSKALAEQFKVNKKQMDSWLQQALLLGRIEKLSKPVRYRLLFIDKDENYQPSLHFDLDEQKM